MIVTTGGILDGPNRWSLEEFVEPAEFEAIVIFLRHGQDFVRLDLSVPAEDRMDVADNGSFSETSIAGIWLDLKLFFLHSSQADCDGPGATPRENVLHLDDSIDRTVRREHDGTPPVLAGHVARNDIEHTIVKSDRPSLKTQRHAAFGVDILEQNGLAP